LSVTKLDRIDQEILEILSKHGRITYVELAKMVHRSPSAVRKRVEQMLRNELIERFTVVLNPQKMGKMITASLTIQPATRRFERVSDFVERMSFVVEAYHMTGKCGILAVVQVADIEALDECIHEIQSLEGVLAVEACVALKRIK
jgi:Lrp/AsnC family leucine-responsive transcriptional regulator